MSHVPVVVWIVPALASASMIFFVFSVVFNIASKVRKTEKKISSETVYVIRQINEDIANYKSRADEIKTRIGPSSLPNNVVDYLIMACEHIYQVVNEDLPNLKRKLSENLRSYQQSKSSILGKKDEGYYLASIESIKQEYNSKIAEIVQAYEFADGKLCVKEIAEETREENAVSANPNPFIS